MRERELRFGPADWSRRPSRDVPTPRSGRLASPLAHQAGSPCLALHANPTARMRIGIRASPRYSIGWIRDACLRGFYTVPRSLNSWLTEVECGVLSTQGR
jgi:hypothetical protein